MRQFIIVVHLLLVLLAYTAWIWLDWRILAIVALAHILMLEVLKGCPLSHVQFPEDKNKRFYEWWMGKLGVDVVSNAKRRHSVRVFMQFGLPLLIVAAAVFLQIVLDMRPLVSLS